MSINERLWARVAKTDGCWNWTGGTNGRGYGTVWSNEEKRRIYVHRLAWETVNGPIPDGLVIDHLCRNTLCVNPDHLEPVTMRTNTIRGVGIDRAATARRGRTHCPQGHEYTDANTYVNKAGSRNCRACTRARNQRRRQQQPKETA